MVIPIKIISFHIDLAAVIAELIVNKGEESPFTKKTYKRTVKHKYPSIRQDITVKVKSEPILPGHIIMFNGGLQLMCVSKFQDEATLKNLATCGGGSLTFDSTVSEAIILSSAAPEV